MQERFVIESTYHKVKQHMETNADTLASIAIASHIQQYIKKSFGDNITQENVEFTIIVLCSCLLNHIANFYSDLPNIYFKEHKHPHPFLRLFTVNLNIVNYLNQSEFFKEKGIFSSFLTMDLFSLMGITAASIKNGKPSMVNGANLMFSKDTFEAVNGYNGNENVASGDDIFLMQKINKTFPGEIVFLKNYDAVTETLPPQNFIDFVNQRIRWTSKSSRHADTNIVLTLSLNYFYYLCLFIGFIISFYHLNILYIISISFLIKIILDGIFFSNILNFFKRKKLLKSLVSIEILHLFYINILGILSLIGKYTWKGRKV